MIISLTIQPLHHIHRGTIGIRNRGGNRCRDT
uniref:Uncharacterized protein n=1 Tax=Siphoviridae sp. ctKvA22 TaxID=2826246 RepID=A0A8S5MAE5_9CAUD|nr:MAG TPA: hypothetical protein [Siphoviridae sp. ctKvA22]DAF25370.1 MAG TPA: hypothetical protein [Caudoviricetes sp.]